MHNSHGTDTSLEKPDNNYSEWYNDMLEICMECCNELDIDPTTHASYRNHLSQKPCTICEENGYHHVFINSTIEESIHETMATFTDMERAAFNDITMRDYSNPNTLTTA